MVFPYQPLPMSAIDCIRNVAVEGTGTIWGSSIDLRQAHYTALRILATSSAGTPNLLVQWEVGPSRPSVEGSSDTNYVIPDNMTDPYTALSTETTKYIQFFSPPTRYGRLRITGNASNNADTGVVLAQIIIQG